MMRTGLGIDITPDVMNDFFQIKPNKTLSNGHQIAKHHVGTCSFMQSNSGYATPYKKDWNDSLEQHLKLSSMSLDTEDLTDNLVSKPEKENELLLPEPEERTNSIEGKAISIEVYDNYQFKHEYDPLLPITSKHDEIIQTIEANRVTVIQGSTGSGKTTQVPQYILDYHQQRSKYCNILVTQPRKIAAVSIAKRVSQERGWPIGTLVGFQVSRKREVTEDTRITYMTTGVLLQKLIKNKNLNDYTHIILDEIHERDQDIDFSMLVVRKYLRTVSRHVKVVLMSATVDSTLFANYFSVLINGKQEPAPVLNVEGKMYEVSEYYFNDIATLAAPPQQSLYEPEISEKCYQFCRELIMALDVDEIGDDYKVGMFSETRGTVLVFLPGLPEIKQMHLHLADIEARSRLKIIPLHSQITSNEQIKVFLPSEKRERKVILSTNIAESSITVPDIKYVIDFCLTKQNETDMETNYQRLTLQWASQASLTQRKGRAGRVSEGYCFRLISKSMFYELPEYCTPEILRSPLQQLVLKVKLLDLGSPAHTLMLSIQPPSLTDIQKTILLLKEVGAITVRQNGKINPLDGDLTFVGRVLGSLPVDVRIGKLLLIGYTFGVLEECLTIAGCLSLKSIFSRPFQRDLKAYSNKMHWSRYSGSDLLASLHAFMSWKFRKIHTGFGMNETKWAHENFLEFKRFVEVDELIMELHSRLAQFNIHANKNIFESEVLPKDDEFILKLVIAGAFYPNYFQTQPLDEQEAIKTMSGLNPFTTVVISGAPPTLCHYKQSVAKLFRQCGRGKKLYFENSRAFVEFENFSTGEDFNPVAPAVYMAIKMRHLRMPLDIYVSKQRDEELRKTLASNPLQPFNPETGLRTNRINTYLNKDSKISVTLQGNVKQVMLKECGYFHLQIQEVLNVDHFWATYADKETIRIMHHLHNKINEFGGRNWKPMEPENIQVGAYCLAPYEDEFFRAEIIAYSPNLIKVFFLDYGNSTQLVEKSYIRKCPDSLLEIPFQAFECFLSEVKPSRTKWTDQALNRFVELAPVGSAVLIAKVYSVVHGAYHLELFNGDTSINQTLIKENYAVYKEETLQSQRYHEQSLNIETKSMTQESSDIFISDVSRIEKGEEVIKIPLRGPHSPYELSFFGLTASARLRGCRVEQDSVNSVVICEDPHDKHQKLLIAATVNVNSAGNSIIARETTLLPNIHGLYSMLALLFAPVAELRCHAKNTHYIGALCGLGANDNGESILPDHDLELSFDIKFDAEDLLLINSVRFLINTAIGIESETIEHPIDKVSEIQKYAREKLLNLINKQREDKTPESYPKEFLWNQVKDDYLFDCGYEEKPNHLYTYHKGIFLIKEKEIDPRILEQRQKLEELHKLTGRSIIPFTTEVECPVCLVRCRHPRALYLHCETPQHKNWFTQIFKN
ncbi:ATP-dependent RNA helicase TDRD9 isoform X2 [Hydra vulgaris]|uniref:RNA helicase n=1 Tax=Hydra vulgaris TaxID=6087 RepID=A0ABM4CJ52_HYDVU